MPLCHAPWTNIDVDTQGKISPCCKFRTQGYAVEFYIQHQGVQGYLQSDFLKQIREQHQQGEWPQGCARCQIEEQHGVLSKRQLDQRRWRPYYDSYDFDHGGPITAALAFGNVCNLKCMICGPYASSRWQEEYARVYDIPIRSERLDQEAMVSAVLAAAPNLIHLDVSGGEPMLSHVDAQQRLLAHYIESGQSSSIGLHYTTNATVFPDASWWQLWQHFREVDVQLSLDGVDKRFEYLRFPANWKQVLDTVEGYQRSTANNLRLSVSHTVSALNVAYLPEFLDWCHRMQLPEPWLGRLHAPAYLRPSVWPEYARHEIAVTLRQSSHPSLLQWANMLESNDDSDQFDDFVAYVARHDRYRNLDYAELFPDMAGYLDAD